MNRIKKKDKVIIIRGKDKGKIGIVSKVLKKYNENDKIYYTYFIIDGINLFKKHKKANPNKKDDGGIVTFAAKIISSKVSIFSDKLNKKDKISFIKNENNKYRIYRSNKEVVN
jgi:large subunit ribosomal protein L24